MNRKQTLKWLEIMRLQTSNLYYMPKYSKSLINAIKWLKIGLLRK